MGQNIRLTNNLLENITNQIIRGILIHLNFKKAFDVIECEFIQNMPLVFFNFGDNNQQWKSTFYTYPESYLINNGFCTSPF